MLNFKEYKAIFKQSSNDIDFNEQSGIIKEQLIQTGNTKGGDQNPEEKELEQPLQLVKHQSEQPTIRQLEPLIVPESSDVKQKQEEKILETCTNLIFRVKPFKNEQLNLIWTYEKSEKEGEVIILLNEMIFLRNESVKAQYDKRGPYEIPALEPEKRWWDNDRDLEVKGPITLKDGAIYVGQCLVGGDVPTGRGVLLGLKGHLYEGYWKQGEYHSIGRVIHRNGNIYQGELILGPANGHGKYFWPDGASFEGIWKDDQKNGHGVKIEKSGNRYDGNFKNDKYNGFGTLTYKSGGDVYKGFWKDNRMHGQGKYLWSGGSYYDGEWNDSQFHGLGHLKLNRESYMGMFQNDKKHGFGTKAWAEGDKFSGYWKDDK